MIYFSYIHSIVTYSVIFWGNSPYIINIFGIQRRRRIRIIMNSRNRDPCGEMFKNLKILPLYSQYIFSLLSVVVVKNKDQYKSNQEVHSSNTRYCTNFHPPISNLAAFQRGAYYFGIKVVSHLPSTIKCLSNERNYLDLPLKDLFFLIHFIPQMIILIVTTINSLCLI